MMKMIRRDDYETYYEYLQAIKESRNDEHEQSDSMYRQEGEEKEDEGENKGGEREEIYCTECEAEATGYYVSEPEKDEIPLCDTCMQIFQVGLYYGLKGIDVEIGSIEDMNDE
jgi:hypothetical protein